MRTNKLRYIFIGLVIGLIIGLGISTISDNLAKFDYLIKLKDLLTFKTKFEDELAKPDSQSAKKQMALNTGTTIDSVRTNDSLNASFPDTAYTVYSENTSEPAGADNSDAIVYRDKMICSKYFKVKGLSETGNNKIGLLDSLLMNDSQKHPDDMLLVEFWQSPVNYRGYKLCENKLIIFGIDDFATSFIEVINKEIYIYSKNKYYLLEYTTDYKPLILYDRYDGNGSKKNEKNSL